MNSNKSETKRTYNKHARTYANAFDSLGVQQEDIQLTLSFVSEPNPSILELGFGSGRDASEFVKITDKYIGVDNVPEFVQLAGEKVPAGHFQEADFTTFNFPKGLDCIYAAASLLHINKEEFQEILDQAYESLNNNGVFFLTLKMGTYTEKKQEDELGVRYFYYYTPELVKSLAGDRFKCVYEQIRDLKGKKWFAIIIQKVK